MLEWPYGNTKGPVWNGMYVPLPCLMLYKHLISFHHNKRAFYKVTQILDIRNFSLKTRRRVVSGYVLFYAGPHITAIFGVFPCERRF